MKNQGKDRNIAIEIITPKLGLRWEREQFLKNKLQKNNVVVLGNMMDVPLAADHRGVDGAHTADYPKFFAELIPDNYDPLL